MRWMNPCIDEVPAAAAGHWRNMVDEHISAFYCGQALM